MSRIFGRPGPGRGGLTRAGRAVIAVAVAGAVALAPALAMSGAEAKPVGPERRASTAPNVMYPVKYVKGVKDLRKFKKRKFKGTEIKARCGTPVVASHPGRLVLQPNSAYGSYLVGVTTSRGQLTTWYGYMRTIEGTAGQLVQSGQQIGTVGNLGRARGACKLYFAVHNWNKVYSPTWWLDTYVSKPAPITALFDNRGFNLASYNVLGASHTGAGARYPSYSVRTPRMINTLNQFRIDVAGLQEFEKSQRDMFQTTAGGTFSSYYIGSELDLQERPLNVENGEKKRRDDPRNAIIWRNSAMEFVSGYTIQIPYFNGALVDIPVVLLRDRSSDRTAYFLNTHNPASIPKYGNQAAHRARALAIEKDEIIKLRATGRPVFITGDFNDREAAFCPMTAGKLSISPNSIPSMGCAMPKLRAIDWIFGAGPARFSNFVYDWGPKNQGITDHPLVVARTHLAE